MRVSIEVALQTLLSYFAILFITRIIGRKQLAQLTVHEYINGITFGSIAATLATDINQRTWHHLIGLFIFGFLTYLMSYIGMKNRGVSRVVEGTSVLVIDNGRIIEKNLKKFHYTIDDLNHLLRTKDIFNINNVKYAVLETTGEISVMKKPSEENVKVSDLNLKGTAHEIPVDIIITGTVIYENLKNKNLTFKWLASQLKTMGIRDIKEVYYASIDENNQLYVDRYD